MFEVLKYRIRSFFSPKPKISLSVAPSVKPQPDCFGNVWVPLSEEDDWILCSEWNIEEGLYGSGV